jgi:hemerythrin-like domain-containing protein
VPKSRISRLAPIVLPFVVLAWVGCRVESAPEDAAGEETAAEPVSEARSSGRGDGESPRFTAEGELIRPEGWEAWVMTGASIGLSYAEPGAPTPASDGPGMFHNVYMQPWAYRHFLDTGEFAEETMFILAFYGASQDADPAQSGFFEGELAPVMEVHLKKQDLHESGWGFYGFSGDAESAEMIVGTAPCYSCVPPMNAQSTATAELRDEHQLILKVVDVLEEIANRGSTGGEADVEGVSECITFFRQFTDACHHGKEEGLLFPELQAQGMPVEGGPIAVMLEEHRIGRALVGRMAEAVEATIAGDEDATARLWRAARDYVDMLRGHILKEDGVLFEMADMMIVGPACRQLCEAYGTTCLGHMDGHTREDLEALAARLVEKYLIA